MKKLSAFFSCAFIALSVNAEKTVVTLDLSNPGEGNTIEYVDGYWNKTYEDLAYFDCGVFRFSHTENTWGGLSWDGFSIGTSGDSWDYSADASNFTYTSAGWYTVKKNGFGNMAGGGLKIAENGTISTEKGLPYLVAYWNSYVETPSLKVSFNDNKARELKGVYISASPWTFYSYINGDGFARAFREGDCHKVIVHAIDENGTEKENTVEIVLAKYEDGMLSMVKNWKYVNLTSLGKVTAIYFTLDSTDVSSSGVNTSSYFCLDKLQVYEAESSSVTTTLASDNAPVEYYNLQGIKVENPAGGVYIKRQGGNATKVVL